MGVECTVDSRSTEVCVLFAKNLMKRLIGFILMLSLLLFCLYGSNILTVRQNDMKPPRKHSQTKVSEKKDVEETIEVLTRDAEVVESVDMYGVQRLTELLTGEKKEGVFAENFGLEDGNTREFRLESPMLDDLAEMLKNPVKIPETSYIQETREEAAGVLNEAEEVSDLSGDTIAEADEVTDETDEIPEENSDENQGGTDVEAEEFPENPEDFEQAEKTEPEEIPNERDLYPVLLDGFLIDADRMIIGTDPATLPVEDAYLELPDEGCAGIRAGAFSACPVEIIELLIPANITKIETGAFRDLPALEWLEAEQGNPAYVSEDGVIYDAGVNTLIAFPGARTGTFEMPGTVRRIESCAMANTSLSALEMRKCGEIELGPNIFCGGSGEGIQIYASGEWEEAYRAVFAPYQVEIIGYYR